MAMDQKPCTKCNGVPLESNRGGKSTILALTPIVTIGGGFQSNATHVNHPESCIADIMIIHIYVYELILCPNSHLGPPARYYLYNFSKYISSCFTISFNLSYDSLYTNVVAAVFRNVLMPK